jgi:uncharacterized coiled-coil protein SlyX
MPSYRKNIIALAFLCLSFSALAQYQKAAKGEPVPFDTAVIVELGEYRKIRSKVLLADSLVQSLSFSLSLSLQAIAQQDSTISAQAFTIAAQEKTIARKDEVIQQVSTRFDELNKLATRPKRWYQKDGLKYGLGAAAMLLIIKSSQQCLTR